MERRNLDVVENKNIDTDKEISQSLNSVQLYLSKIGYAPLLSAEEEIHYGRLARKGDHEAENHIVESNLRLVIKIAKDYLNKGLSFLDLIEEGNLGLMHAAKKFDPELGYRFSTYATWWIKQNIERAIMNQGRMIRLPVHIEKDLYKLLKISRNLSKKLGREPTVQEIARAAKRPVLQVQRMLESLQNPVSIDTPIREGSDKSIAELIPDTGDKNPAKILLKDQLLKKVTIWIRELEPKYQDILKRRFALTPYSESATFEEIGESVGLSRERVRQMQKEALLQLRKIFEQHGLTIDILFEMGE